MRSQGALDFWAERLHARGCEPARTSESLRFADHDGLELELVAAGDGNRPLRAEHPEVPPEHAIIGIEGARAYSVDPEADRRLLSGTLGFTHLSGGEYRLDGADRRFSWAYDPAPELAGIQGAGSVHHIAWASADDDHLAWRERVKAAGAHVTGVIDRDYFRSVYFREPHGILFEIATLSPGFAIDEDAAHLGEELRLPRRHEHLRERLEQRLTPLENPRSRVNA